MTPSEQVTTADDRRKIVGATRVRDTVKFGGRGNSHNKRFGV